MTQRTRLAWVAGLTLVESALLQELRKPPEQRSWHGRIAGLIPYDLRPPTVERITRAWWTRRTSASSRVKPSASAGRSTSTASPACSAGAARSRARGGRVERRHRYRRIGCTVSILKKLRRDLVGEPDRGLGPVEEHAGVVCLASPDGQDDGTRGPPPTDRSRRVRVDREMDILAPHRAEALDENRGGCPGSRAMVENRRRLCPRVRHLDRERMPVPGADAIAAQFEAGLVRVIDHPLEIGRR